MLTLLPTGSKFSAVNEKNIITTTKFNSRKLLFTWFPRRLGLLLPKDWLMQQMCITWKNKASNPSWGMLHFIAFILWGREVVGRESGGRGHHWIAGYGAPLGMPLNCGSCFNHSGSLRQHSGSSICGQVLRWAQFSLEGALWPGSGAGGKWFWHPYYKNMFMLMVAEYCARPVVTYSFMFVTVLNTIVAWKVTVTMIFRCPTPQLMRLRFGPVEINGIYGPAC